MACGVRFTIATHSPQHHESRKNYAILPHIEAPKMSCLFANEHEFGHYDPETCGLLGAAEKKGNLIGGAGLGNDDQTWSADAYADQGERKEKCRGPGLHHAYDRV